MQTDVLHEAALGRVGGDTGPSPLWRFPTGSARRRETAHLETVYRFHPLFGDAGFERWFGGVDHDHGTASIEGGDVHVIGRGALLVGMGERTTPRPSRRSLAGCSRPARRAACLRSRCRRAGHSCTSTP
jgi:hypothetical protein